MSRGIHTKTETGADVFPSIAFSMINTSTLSKGEHVDAGSFQITL